MYKDVGRNWPEIDGGGRKREFCKVIFYQGIFLYRRVALILKMYFCSFIAGVDLSLLDFRLLV